jgi:putative endonuclease
MAWYVYIIKTDCDKLYTGISTDTMRRFSEHEQMYKDKQGKGAKFFRGHSPKEIVYTEVCEDRSSASKRESGIKKMSVALKRALIESSD